MNWIDRAIGYVSPEAGARRIRGRVALAQMQQLAARAYEGAKNGRRTGGWTAGGSSANTEIAPALSTLRNRCREQVRNNPYAASAIARLTTKTIGTGIIARSDDSIKKPYRLWMEQCDFDDHFDLYGLQNLWQRTAYESGEVLIRRVRTNDGFGLRLQTLEPDYIDSTKFGALGNGNFAIAGVEIDRLGRKKAYWLLKQHPGESIVLPRSTESERVPAEDIIHYGEKLRPGQLRYVPRLAVALMKMRDLDDFEDAELVRKKIEACFVAFVTGGSQNEPLANEVVTDGQTGRRVETLSPGMIKYLPDGQAVSFGNPTGTTDSAFSKRHLHAIAVGTGMTYSLLTGDLSEVSFSSIRSGEQDFRDLVDSTRWMHFIPVVCTRICRWFEESAWTAGRIRSTGYEWEFTPPRWPYVKPSEDIQTLKEEISGGLKSQSEGIREMGREPDEVLNELAGDRKKIAELGLTVDTDPGLAQKAAEANAAAQAEKDAAAEEADKAAKDAAAKKRDEQEEWRRAEHRELVAIAAREIPAPVVNFHEGAIRTEVRAGDTQVTVPDRAVTVEGARVEVAPAQVSVNNPVTVRAYPSASTEDIQRDERGEMTRITRKNED